MKNTMQTPYIARTYGDGSNVTKIRQYELGWPNGLSIDFDTDRLYWVDAYFDRYVLSLIEICQSGLEDKVNGVNGSSVSLHVPRY